MNLLVEMLSFCRPHYSQTENLFIDSYLRPLPGYVEDDFGNGLVQVGLEEPKTLWSCHTDTVHQKGGFQTVLCHDNGWVTSDADCLGADNTVGVFLLHQMILHHVPGLYVFHRGEERGRLGSEFIAANTPQLLEGIDFAIAFDRRKQGSIITQQMWQCTASDRFAKDLAALLGLGHKPDPNGLYTDTYSYHQLVPECTNVSAGFEDEHSNKERVYLPYVEKLRDSLLSADFSGLIPYRKIEEEFNYEFDAIANWVFRHPDETARLLQDLGITLDELWRME